MKLHDMNTVELKNTLCRLVGPMCRIAEDERTQAAFDALAQDRLSRLPLLKGLSAVMAELAPILLQRHWDDMLQIASAVTGKSVGELRAQNGIATVAEFISCLDEDLGAFFSFAADSAQKT